jgi:3-hydroxyisobutyrate dehydrogenase-like beta-hydroxyacid dehydrogenase
MCSTVDPRWSIAWKRGSALGLLYLDAPISGGAAKAASGQMTMMTAGRPAAYAKAGGLLDAMAAKVYRLGDRAGAGSKVKIINQLLAGVHIAAAAEAMALGLREGVDAAALYEVITHSAGNSWMFENRMAHVLAGDYTPLSAVDIFVKDLGLVLDTARASQVPAAAGEHGAPDVHAGQHGGLREGRRQRGDQDLSGHHAAGRRSNMKRPDPRLHRRRLHRRHRPGQQPGARRHAHGADHRRAAARAAAPVPPMPWWWR